MTHPMSFLAYPGSEFLEILTPDVALQILDAHYRPMDVLCGCFKKMYVVKIKPIGFIRGHYSKFAEVLSFL